MKKTMPRRQAQVLAAVVFLANRQSGLPPDFRALASLINSQPWKRKDGKAVVKLDDLSPDDLETRRRQLYLAQDWLERFIQTGYLVGNKDGPVYVNRYQVTTREEAICVLTLEAAVRELKGGKNAIGWGNLLAALCGALPHMNTEQRIGLIASLTDKGYLVIVNNCYHLTNKAAYQLPYLRRLVRAESG